MTTYSDIASLMVLVALGTAVSVGAEATTTDSRRVIEGTVYDVTTEEPIPFVTIRLMGIDRSTLANEEGRYRILVTPGQHQLRFSHIAYYSELVDLPPGDSALAYDIRLHTCMVDVGSVKVYGREYDPGQRIIVEAIRRKEDILARIHDYRFDAYGKLVLVDKTNPDSSEIELITETQFTVYWEQPDKYKQVITARRQSANFDAENNLVTIRNLANFNRNRIELGAYAIVSPTAEDALDHYNYYLLDTLYLDSLAVFRLEIEAINPDEPLFEGFIHIADSTYDVVEVDVGFSRGVKFPLFTEPRYGQRLAQLENEYWMPIEIRFSADVEFEIPVPGLPRRFSFVYTGSLYSFEFEAGHPPGTFGEYSIEIDPAVDEVDSAAWFARQTVPLTAREEGAYRRIDSVENKPPSVGKIALTGLGAAAYLLLIGEEDIYRFNRVEGAYLGYGLDRLEILDNLDLRLKIGYAIDAERSQHQAGFTYRMHRGRKLRLGLDFYNRVVRRPTAISGRDFNPTFPAIVSGDDPLDYYRTRGFSGFVSGKLVDQTRLILRYHDYEHFSMPLSTDYSLFGDDDDPPRNNPPIADGKLRSVGAEFQYDSRKMINNKGRDWRLDEYQYARLVAGIEYAAPELIDSDFDFRRYFVEFRRRQRTLGLGVTQLRVYAGSSDGDLPPQRYFSVDFGNRYFFGSLGFNTLNETNFGGSRALVISAQHNFQRRLFASSGIPMIRDIPFWLSVHGGAFWTDFENHSYRDGDEAINVAARPYREIGFGLGNLTPFISPINLALHFTWQLSHYDTSDFSVFLGLEL